MIKTLATLTGLLSLAATGAAQNDTTKPVYAHFMVGFLRLP